MDYKISENNVRSFSSFAHLIERELLEMQIMIVANRQRLRFVHIHYIDFLSEKELKEIENAVDVMYDLLEQFCQDFNLPLEPANLKNDLRKKADLLLKDLSEDTVKNLQGFKEINEEIKTVYNKKISQMIHKANDLINQFN